MATATATDETLDQTGTEGEDTGEVLELEGETLEGDDTTEGGAEEDEGDEDEVHITIGDEKAEESEEEKQLSQAPQWVKDLRKKARETERENRELKRKLEAPAAKTETVDAVGAKPTLKDYDWDEEQFAAGLEAWHERKRKADEQEAEANRKASEAQTAYQAKLEGYGKQKSELKAKDFDEAEQVVKDNLSPMQQSMLVKGAANAAVLVYALGKNPKKAQELAALTDPVEFIAAAIRLETQLKVTTRKTAPLPEKKLSGSGPVATGGGDAALARLREAAEKTGDYTEVNKYKQKLKAAQK
jgi:hypothetical protein